jgi:hypothetical protein
MDEFAIAHEELELAGALAAINDELCARVKCNLSEIEHVMVQARALRAHIEKCWVDLLSLMSEHEQLLKGFFSDTVPDNCQLVFERLSGLDRAEAEFVRLLKLVQNTVPDYPDDLRDERDAGVDD